MLLIKSILNCEKSKTIQIDCFFSMPKKGIDYHFSNQICIEKKPEGYQMWFGYPNEKHARKIQDAEIIEFIIQELKAFKAKTESDLKIIMDTISET